MHTLWWVTPNGNSNFVWEKTDCSLKLDFFANWLINYNLCEGAAQLWRILCLCINFGELHHPSTVRHIYPVQGRFLLGIHLIRCTNAQQGSQSTRINYSHCRMHVTPTFHHQNQLALLTHALCIHGFVLFMTNIKPAHSMPNRNQHSSDQPACALSSLIQLWSPWAHISFTFLFFAKLI